MRYGSTFSGIGGFDLALDRTGATAAWQVEIDPKASACLANHWPDVERHTDIKECSDLSRVDLICGGFPCQDLSVAGRRAGLAGERSGLFYEFARLIEEQSPRWVVLENVPGLLSSNRGRDMGAVLGTLAELGYGFAYRVFDARYFGVAQRRRRVFIVGHLGNSLSAIQVLFESEGVRWNPPTGQEAGQEVAGTLGGGSGGRGWCADTDRMTYERHSVGVSVPVAAGQRPGRYGKGVNTTVDDGAVIAFHMIQDPISGADFAPSLGAKSGGMGVAFAENQRAEVRESTYSPALSAGGGKPGSGFSANRTEAGVRRLTPTECERLQGFPDGWTEGFADSVRYRMLGNAVAVPVVEWIAHRIMHQEAA